MVLSTPMGKATKMARSRSDKGKEERRMFGFGRARMDYKSRVLIPKAVMKELGLTGPMELLVAVNEKDEIILIPLK